MLWFQCWETKFFTLDAGIMHKCELDRKFNFQCPYIAQGGFSYLNLPEFHHATTPKLSFEVKLMQYLLSAGMELASFPATNQICRSDSCSSYCKPRWCLGARLESCWDGNHRPANAHSNINVAEEWQIKFELYECVYSRVFQAITQSGWPRQPSCVSYSSGSLRAWC